MMKVRCRKGGAQVVRSPKAVFVNLILLGVSLAVVAVAAKFADWAVGRLHPSARTAGVVDLIFPPRSEMAFKTAEYDYAVRINSIGIRDGEVSLTSSNALRVAVIGDSFTYGFGVDIESTWVKILERELRDGGLDVEVLNLGKPGAGIVFYSELAQRALPILRPDVLIVAMLQADDVADAGGAPQPTPDHPVWAGIRQAFPNLTGLVERKLQKTREGGAIEAVRPPIHASAEDSRAGDQRAAAAILDGMPPEQRARYDGVDTAVREAFTRGELNPFIVNMATMCPDFFVMHATENDAGLRHCVELAGDYLGRIRRAAEAAGARVFVVSVPHGIYANRAAMAGYARLGFHVSEDLLRSDVPDEAIRAACNSAGLPFLSVTPQFRERSGEEGLYFAMDGHFTAAGHDLFAQALAPRLKPYLAEKDP